jgi:hypothetical protein
MNQDQRTIEALKDILREIEFIEYEDSDTGLEYFCPICGGRPEREKLPRGVREMYPSMGGKGHDKNCKLARALYGPA